MKLVFEILHPYIHGTIRIYRLEDMACYEWRIVECSGTVLNSGTGYGVWQAALRDALIDATQ